jgi:hypothetical protein
MKKNVLIAVFVMLSVIVSAQITSLKKSIFFQTGKTSLTEEHKSILDSALDQILKANSYDVEVKGYTDNTGSLNINKSISKIRALNVYSYLIDKGVSQNMITYVGLAHANPMGDNKTVQGRAMNRRTDIEVLFKIDNQNNASSNTSEFQNGNSVDQNVANPNVSINKWFSNGPIVNLGPEISSGSFDIAGNKIIKATNCISIEIPEGAFATQLKEKFEFDFKDYSKNYDIIKKGIQTYSGRTPMKLYAAFFISFSQANEDITLNMNKPIQILVPGEYDPEIKLYTNHRNWAKDTINGLSYDQEKKSYVITLKYLGQMFGLMKSFNNGYKNVLIKIKGVDPDKVKPYMISEDCMITSGKRVKGKLYTFAVNSEKDKMMLRSSFIDYSSSKPANFYLNEDITMDASKSSEKEIDGMKYTRICTPSKVFFMENTAMDKSSLCETPCVSQ